MRENNDDSDADLRQCGHRRVIKNGWDLQLALWALQSPNSNANSISDCVATHCSPISNADADSIPNEISAPTPISDNVAIMAYNHV